MCLAHFIGMLGCVGCKILSETVLINLSQYLCWWCMENWDRETLAATLHFQIHFHECKSLYLIGNISNFVPKGSIKHYWFRQWRVDMIARWLSGTKKTKKNIIEPMIHGLQLLNILSWYTFFGHQSPHTRMHSLMWKLSVFINSLLLWYTYSYIDKDISHIHCTDYAFGNFSTYFFKQNKIPWYKPIHNPNCCLLYLMHMYYWKTKQPTQNTIPWLCIWYFMFVINDLT